MSLLHLCFTFDNDAESNLEQQQLQKWHLIWPPPISVISKEKKNKICCCDGTGNLFTTTTVEFSYV